MDRARLLMLCVVVGMTALWSGCDDGAGSGTTTEDTAVEETTTETDATTEDATEEVDAGCTSGEACESGVCDTETGACAEPVCDDGVQNGTEADVDCGGSCLPCGAGSACVEAKDCVTATCTDGTCIEPSCDDGVQNGFESDVDCGGDCDACAEGQGCFEGPDCASGSCQVDGEAGVCILETCEDGISNNAETGTDCGGPNCGPCGADEGCERVGDCVSLVCTDGVCAAASCSDGLQNGTETYIDCGGEDCSGCGAGDGCSVNEDCASVICDETTRTCIAASCSDEVINSGESDVDCGGDNCAPCVTGQICNGPTDCASGICDAGTCGAPVETCKALEAASPKTPSGAYTVGLNGSDSRPVQVYCDLETDGGGWTLISVVRNDVPGQVIASAKGYCDSLDTTLACKGHMPPSGVTTTTQLLLRDLDAKDTWLIYDRFEIRASRSALYYFSGQRALSSSSSCITLDHFCGEITDTNLRIFKTSGFTYNYSPPLRQWWRYGGWWVGADPNSGNINGNVHGTSYSSTHRLSSRADAAGLNALHSNGHQAIFWR